MRGPPPQRDPPIPPLIQNEASTAYVVDDSQYDEPGIPPEIKEYYKGYFLTLTNRQYSMITEHNSF